MLDMNEMISTMAEAGWQYDALEHHFVKGDLWLTYGQAVSALTAAESGEEWLLNEASPVAANEA